MPNLTAHYQLYKPLVADAIDEDLWGGYLNDNFDSLDTLIFNGVRVVSSSKTANYTILPADNNSIILVDATTGPVTITLPSAGTAGDGFHVKVKKMDATANAVTFVGTVDGVTPSLTLQYDLLDIGTNGTVFYSLGPKISGGYVQKAYAVDATTTTTTTIIPLDDTIPQSTEGVQFISLAYTPKSATNVLFIRIKTHIAVAGAAQVASAICLFKDVDTDALSVGAFTTPDNDRLAECICYHYMVAGSTSAITFKGRVGIALGSTVTINGISGTRRYGGKLFSSIEIIEYAP